MASLTLSVLIRSTRMASDKLVSSLKLVFGRNFCRKKILIKQDINGKLKDIKVICQRSQNKHMMQLANGNGTLQLIKILRHKIH